MAGGGQHLRVRAPGTEGAQKGRADVQPWRGERVSLALNQWGCNKVETDKG